MCVRQQTFGSTLQNREQQENPSLHHEHLVCLLHIKQHVTSQKTWACWGTRITQWIRGEEKRLVCHANIGFPSLQICMYSADLHDRLHCVFYSIQEDLEVNPSMCSCICYLCWPSLLPSRLQCIFKSTCSTWSRGKLITVQLVCFVDNQSPSSLIQSIQGFVRKLTKANSNAHKHSHFLTQQQQRSKINYYILVVLGWASFSWWPQPGPHVWFARLLCWMPFLSQPQRDLFVR